MAVLELCVLQQIINGFISDHYIDYLRVPSSLWINLRHILTDHKSVFINPHNTNVTLLGEQGNEGARRPGGNFLEGFNKDKRRYTHTGTQG